MGQRLTIEIKDDNKTIAVIYYHWSAYFSSTIYELKAVKDDIVRAKENGQDILLSIIDGLEQRGGGLGIDPDTRALAKEKYPNREFTMDINRNDGLIFLAEKDIEDTLDWSEGWASIDIETEEVLDDVDLEMYNYCSLKDLPVNPFEPMSFDDLENVFQTLGAIERWLQFVRRAKSADIRAENMPLDEKKGGECNGS